MSRSSHKSGRIRSRRVSAGVQSNYTDVVACTSVGISSCENKSLRTRQAKKTHRNTSSESKLSYVFSFLKSITSPISDDQEQEAVAHDSENSRLDPNLKTIEYWLNRFDVPTILPRLEESLEGVKRNKISKECHEQLSKSVDKELQRLSLTFHPDHAGDHEWQSALNSIRKVLKTLTTVFLENTFIDYKYEYFSNLDTSILVNENEINNIIQTLFYKISVLSETKRVNIIGEIRKFLTESERCVKSYFEGNKSDFEKYRDYTLYHLQKTIEGYKKLEKECNILIEECSKENDSMRAVVQSVASQSARESSILKSLEVVARRSFQGNFEIFPIDKVMDEYYILPFIDYVNVLSMCNLLLQPKCARFSSYGFSCNIEERSSFANAYILAAYIYPFKTGNIEVADFTSINEHVKKLHISLGEIFRDLQKDYRADAYNEGKSNRAEMYERLLALKEFLGDLQEKEKNFEERISLYNMERKKSSESYVNYRRDTKETFKVGMTKQEKESGEDSSKFNSLLKGQEIVEELHECKEERSEMPSKVDDWLTVEGCEVALEVREEDL